MLFDSAALFKVLKTATKSGMKGVLQMAKAGTKSTLKAGKQALVATGKGFVKQAGKAKFAVQSVGKGIAKGVKSLDELGQRLAKKFKFKGFKIVVKGFKFYLYGNVNPWVLLASGEVKEISDELAKGKKLGDEVDGGILAGIKGTGKTDAGSAFVSELGEASLSVNGLAKNVKKFEELKSIKDLAARNAKILQGGKGVARDPNFRKNFFNMLEEYGLNISENAKKFIAVHHIVPNFLKGNKPIADFLAKMGHNVDEVKNAIGLPRIDLNLLDETIKALDESIDVLKNTKHLDEIKATLKLGDDVDINELKRIVNELEDIKTASVHAVDTYHPSFNKMMETKMFQMYNKFDDLLKSGISESKAIELYKPEFSIFFNSIVDDLLNGKIKL